TRLLRLKDGTPRGERATRAAPRAAPLEPDAHDLARARLDLARADDFAGGDRRDREGAGRHGEMGAAEGGGEGGADEGAGRSRLEADRAALLGVSPRR